MFSNGRRMKQVTDPLDDRVKARIIGRSHGDVSRAQIEEEDDAISSSSFHEFFFDFSVAGENPPEKFSGDESSEPISDDSDKIEPIVRCHVDRFRNVLEARVSEALDLLSILDLNKSDLRRRVVAILRDFGYNSAICKTKWDRSDGITAGDYEFIDVLRSDSATSLKRYIIDLDFASEFEIARPSNQFDLLLHSLPDAFVGEISDLKKIINAMSEAVRWSLKSRGLHVPPWRKQRYMQNKWLGSYTRTSNFMEFLPPLEQALKCRSIGFDSAAVNRRVLFPVETRTR